MKLTFTEKLVLNNIRAEDDKQIYEFVSYLKTDYVERALIITVSSNIAKKIYFSSNEYGTAEWINGRGIYKAHRWETEDDLKLMSTLARRYPAVLENGSISLDFAMDKIIPDVLDNMLDIEFSYKIYKIIKDVSSDESYNWNDLIEDYKVHSNEYIDRLIKKRESV